MNKTQMKEYYSAKLNKGICKSLKTERIQDFNDFMELFNNHPEKETKLKNVVDLTIVKNKRNSKYYEINVIREDGSTEDISYNCCINQRPKNHNLNMALRYTIEPQIEEFKFNNNNNVFCSFCGDTNNIQVDHITTFKDLTNDFLNNRNDIPVKFDDSPYNSAMFSSNDKKIEEEWYKYHKEHAILRYLCRKCNISRNKKIS